MCSAVTENRSAANRSPAGGELAVFHRTLAELCRSELPLPRALRLLSGDLERGDLRGVVEEMAQAVESGAPLGEAYAERADCFPPLYRALVEAGTASGDLPAMLEEIAAHAATKHWVRARLRKALAYPLVAAGFVVVIGVALLVFVAPILHGLSADLDVLGRNADITADFGSRLFIAGAAVAFLLASMAALAFVACVRGPLEASGAARSFALKIPVLGRLRLLAGLASLASTLALLVRRGVPLTRALDLTAEATPEPAIAARVRRMADCADGGAGLADAVKAADVFPPSLAWLLHAAEQRGEAAEALGDIAAIYRDRLERAVERVTVLVTPIAELIVGVVVFLLAYSFVTPLVEFTGAIFGVR